MHYSKNAKPSMILFMLNSTANTEQQNNSLNSKQKINSSVSILFSTKTWQHTTADFCSFRKLEKRGKHYILGSIWHYSFKSFFLFSHYIWMYCKLYRNLSCFHAASMQVIHPAAFKCIYKQSDQDRSSTLISHIVWCSTSNMKQWSVLPSSYFSLFACSNMG